MQCWVSILTLTLRPTRTVGLSALRADPSLPPRTFLGTHFFHRLWAPELLNADRRIRSPENFHGPHRESNPGPPVLWPNQLRHRLPITNLSHKNGPRMTEHDMTWHDCMIAKLPILLNKDIFIVLCSCHQHHKHNHWQLARLRHRPQNKQYTVHTEYIIKEHTYYQNNSTLLHSTICNRHV